ncbi:MAG TPA: hypothetical protein G4O08_06165 [Anaerolineae bacterium]|nr:hypothetical protein [Anaerolineae bacterium]
MKREKLIDKLNSEFVTLDTPLRAFDPDDNFIEDDQWAFVEEGNSSSEIELRYDQGSITATLWRNGVSLGTYKSTAIDRFDRLARVLSLWCIEKTNVTMIADEFPEINTGDWVEAYEQGPAEYVSFMWEAISRFMENSFPNMMPIVKLALEQPELRELYPYQSLSSLCFSRCTGFPFSAGYPRIEYVEQNKYAVTGMGRQILGEGSAEEAIRIAVANLPPDSGSAFHGAEEYSSGA